jgi:hypothetical protein
MVLEADHLVVSTCGESDQKPQAVVAAEKALAPFLPSQATVAVDPDEKRDQRVAVGASPGGQDVVGARRVATGFQARLLQTRASTEPIPNSEPLRAFFQTRLADYLSRGRASGSDLANPTQARAVFDELRLRLDPRAHAAVDSLEKLADERRQLDRQKTLHFWLHNWLWVHLPLSVALIVLMFVHVFKTLQWLWPTTPGARP